MAGARAGGAPVAQALNRLGHFLTRVGIAGLGLVAVLNPLTLRGLTGRPLQAFNFWLCLGLDALLGSWALALCLLRRHPRLQLGLCVSGATLLLALLGLDLGLSAVRSERLNLFCANPAGTGSYRLRPNLHLRCRNGTVIDTNSQGMRWPEVPPDAPTGVQRVAFLGDSFTFGESADRVENSLTGIFDQRGEPHGVRALNFGVGGYGLDDSELLLRERVWSFHPAAVVVVIFTGNDFRDTYLGLDKFDFDADYNTRGWRQPQFDEKIPSEFRASGNLGKWLHEHSSLYALLKNGPRRPAGGEKARLEPFRPGSTFTLYTFWSRQPYPPVAQAALDRSLAVLDAMRAGCREHGTPFLVVLIPYREQVYATEESGPGFDVRLPQKVVMDWATTAGVPALDLYPLLRGYVLAHPGEELYASEHLNNPGHALAGEWIWDFYQRFERDNGKGMEMHAP